jgi:transcriptional regulator
MSACCRSGSPRALILFRGPEGYISPEYAGTRDWAPTWNYAQISIEAEIVFEPERSGEALSLLVDAMESARANPWEVIELGDRYAAMERQIIGFRACVTRLSGKFKLGQDEQPETLSMILDHVSDPALARWMRRFNPERV